LVLQFYDNPALRHSGNIDLIVNPHTMLTGPIAFCVPIITES
jgi:hypothetical protein